MQRDKNAIPDGLGGRGEVRVDDKRHDGMSEFPEVMNMRQASQYLDVSQETLYRYASDTTVPAFKLGNRWKFKKSVLDQWMERRTASGQKKRPKKKAAK